MNQWLIGLAEEAGRMTLEYREKGFEVFTKPDGSPVTSADLAVDAFLQRELKSRHPGDCVLSEESPDDPLRGQARRVWIVDPIDGTAHYAAMRDGFGILIALCIDGEADECVALFPMHKILLYARRTFGAFVNGRAVKVSANSTRPKIATHAERFLPLHTAPAQLRNNAIAIFQVITGELEGCICMTSPSTGEHDYAWASCAFESAGGMLTDIDGVPLRYNKAVRRMPAIVLGSNGLVHNELMANARALMD
ncbi:MAG: inositol monophosphatase family protein [Candidatus Hydrogenedentes bacterium]|nr:inositol monophosphatase family protein [Candidatus Hydrogenedentota bacterium]